MTITRHKLIQDSLGHRVCNCGYDPFHLLDPEPLDSNGQTLAVLAHIRKSRRWTYRGAETHYGYTYYLWENELTGRKFAWEVDQYRAQLVAA